MDLLTALSAAPPAAGIPAGAGSDPDTGEGDGAFAGLLEQATAAPEASAASAAATAETPVTPADAVPPPAAVVTAAAAAAAAAIVDEAGLPVVEVPQATPVPPPAPAVTITPAATEAAVEAAPPPQQKPAGGVHRAHRVDLTPGLQEAGEEETTEEGLAVIAEAAAEVEVPAAETGFIPEAPVEAPAEPPADPAVLAAIVAPSAPPPAPKDTAPLPGGVGAVAADKAAAPPAAEVPPPAPADMGLLPADTEAPLLPTTNQAAAAASAAATEAAEAATATQAAASAAAPPPRNDMAKARSETAAAARGIGASEDPAGSAVQGTATAGDPRAEPIAATLATGERSGEQPADDGTGLMRSEPTTGAQPGAPAQAATQAKAVAEAAAAQAKSTLAYLTASDQVAVHVARAIDAGTDSISIRLDPADLGRVDVTLDFDADGNVSATVLAERPETLRLLQRDAQSLERAFADAGLKADSGALNFGLRRDNGGAGQEQGGRDNQGGFTGFGRDGGGNLADAAPIIPPRALASMRALDIRI